MFSDCQRDTLAGVVVPEFIAHGAASFPLAVKGAVCVDAHLANSTVVSAIQTLVDILGLWVEVQEKGIQYFFPIDKPRALRVNMVPHIHCRL